MGRPPSEDGKSDYEDGLGDQKSCGEPPAATEDRDGVGCRTQVASGRKVSSAAAKAMVLSNPSYPS